jgi:anti-sigma factor RsiW
MIIYYLFILVAAVMPPKKGKHGSNCTATVEAHLDTQEALAAAVRVMQQELATLRQATPPTAATTVTTSAALATSTIPATHAVPSGVPQVAIPVSGISLMQWIGMKLDSFDGSGSPVDVADWLTYVEDKMDVFEVVSGDCVHYGTQLLKGEAHIWWRGV